MYSNYRMIKVLTLCTCFLIVVLTVINFKDHEVVQTKIEGVQGIFYPSTPQADNFSDYRDGYNSNEQMVETDLGTTGKVKATFVVLARNNEMNPIIESIRSVQDRFNDKYHYPWTFFNDEEFSEEFKLHIRNILQKEKVEFATIPKEHWSYPEWISEEKAAQTREDMKNIIYGGSESYRHMCRYNSGFFYRQELLKDYEYYWRVEPGIKLRCNIDYDPFQFMKDNNKKYGFTISLYEYLATIPTLWQTTKDFIKEHPSFLDENNLMDFISKDGGETYNLCHFWSNFEIASLDFWRGEAYSKYFEYLDKAGGFFYERWGDAPVHSLAAALFLSRDQVHYFEDIGYTHNPYTNCPLNMDIWTKKQCDCDRSNDFTFQGYSCGNRYYDVMRMMKPHGWMKFRDD